MKKLEKNKSFTIRIPEEYLQVLDSIAVNSGVSRSKLVVDILRKSNRFVREANKQKLE